MCVVVYPEEGENLGKEVINEDLEDQQQFISQPTTSKDKDSVEHPQP